MLTVSTNLSKDAGVLPFGGEGEPTEPEPQTLSLNRKLCLLEPCVFFLCASTFLYGP